MDTDYKYSDHMRCGDGQRMYIKLNDGETALKWFNEAIERREDYANALGGAAIAHTLLGHFDKGEELYKLAMLNNIDDPVDFIKLLQGHGSGAVHDVEFIKKLT